MARIGLKGLTYATLSSGGSGSALVYTGGATHADMMISADVQMTRENVKLYADNHAVGFDWLLLVKVTSLIPFYAEWLTVTENDIPYICCSNHSNSSFRRASAYIAPAPATKYPFDSTKLAYSAVFFIVKPDSSTS